MPREFSRTTVPVEERSIKERPDLEGSQILKWKNYSKRKNYREIKGPLSKGIRESLK